ncbi:MAG: phosphotransferase family protein [Planctomycetota bacterium]|jgi:aminoglycoside phosphotransferase (APT) family kinase protein
MDFTDNPSDIRKGEELNADRVDKFIRDAIPDLSGEMTIQQFPRGASNLTYLITIGGREMILRRPPFGTKAKTAHDMNREYRILTALNPVFSYCPQPIVYTDDESIMGCPFYLMERISGIILRRDLPSGLDLTPQQVRHLFEKLVSVQFELHAIDYHKIGLENFGKPQGYVERQVLLQEHRPPDSGNPAIIHNDFKLDNAMLDKENPTKIIGVLDWEMATIGDPLMDLGSSLAYWVESGDPPELQAIRTLPTHLEGALSRKQMIEYYGKLSGRSIEDFSFYYCFGLFRLAVIAQQIYYRYYHGQTKDERFKGLILAVGILEKVARSIIEKM